MSRDHPGPLLAALDGEYPDRPDAVTVGNEATSWESLALRADVTAQRILGARSAAIVGTSSLDTIIGVVACLRAGVPVVPIAPDSGPTERRHILNDSSAELLLVGSDAGDDAGLARVEIAPTGSVPTSHHDPSAIATISDGATAIILYTSGTTGPPKGVQIPRRAIKTGLDGLADAWQWSHDDHLAHGLPLFHVHGLILGVLGPLRRGSALTHTVRPTPEGYAAAADQGASMFFGVPTVWGRVVDEPSAARQLGSARLLVSGSAALPAPVFDGLRQLTGHAPVERYGMTETLITLSTRADGPRIPGSVGRPIEGVETCLLDDHQQPVPNDGVTIGDLAVRGRTLFNGYLNLPEKTAESYTGGDTEDGWFITGDAATIDSDGMHRIVGRKSVDIIKSGGYKIGAGEIESVLLGIDGIAEAAVVGMPDPDLGERVVAFVVGNPSATDHEIIQEVAHSLSVHKRPREVRRVESLPRNALGKVQKRALTDDS